MTYTPNGNIHVKTRFIQQRRVVDCKNIKAFDRSVDRELVGSRPEFFSFCGTVHTSLVLIGLSDSGVGERMTFI